MTHCPDCGTVRPDSPERADLLSRLEANARFYGNEAKGMKPAEARNLGPEESGVIAKLLTEAATALKEPT